MISTVKQFLDIITNDKIIIGLCIIFLNIASRYIDLKLTKNQELIIKNLGKEVLVFFIAFIGTRDFIVSIILTILYWIIVTWLLHEDSNFCILPENLKKLHKAIDLNDDNKITKEELDKAYDILEKAKNNNVNNDNVNNDKYNFYNNFNGLGVSKY